MMNNRKSFISVTSKYLLLIIIYISGLQAQEINTVQTVSGVVADYSGTHLPGASIVVKGTTIGTASNIDGKYLLNIPENAILKISYIGFVNQEIAVENRQEINVMMEEIEDIKSANPINLTEKQSKKVVIDNSFAFKML